MMRTLLPLLDHLFVLNEHGKICALLVEYGYIKNVEIEVQYDLILNFFSLIV
jgi:hypothetical protein